MTKHKIVTHEFINTKIVSENGVTTVTRDGKTTVVTGWRAWVLTAALMIAGALMIALAAFAVAGSMTLIWLFVLVAIPAIAVIGLINVVLGRN